MSDAEAVFKNDTIQSFLSFCRQAMVPDDYIGIDIAQVKIWAECVQNAYGEVIIKTYYKRYLAVMVYTLATQKWSPTRYYDVEGFL